jgi:hypothetical protein
MEDTFYESGKDIAERIVSLCSKVSRHFICNLASYVRHDLKLRSAALFLLDCAIRGNSLERDRYGMHEWISDTITRADELAELLALYWRDGKKPLPNQLKAGLAKAFCKFDAYQLGKYNRDYAIKLRDVMFLCHPKPKDAEQAEVFKKLANNNLKSPDTWEVALSAGADKKATFERLLTDGKLGYLALIRNLRNMSESGVSRALVSQALLAGAENNWAFPYQFISAAIHAPEYADELNQAMLISARNHVPRLDGINGILVDVSGSMGASMSSKSKATRMQAAASLAICLRETGNCVVAGYDDGYYPMPNYRGIPLYDKLAAISGGATYTGRATERMLNEHNDIARLFVVTDEQAHDKIPNIGDRKGYYINVAPYKPSLPDVYNRWTRISGFSERIFEWVKIYEKE